MNADQIVGPLIVAGSILTLAAAVLIVAWKFRRDLDAAWTNPFLDADLEPDDLAPHLAAMDAAIQRVLEAGPLDESAETFDAALLPLSDSPAARRIRAMLDEQAALVELRAEIDAWEAS